jgi:hypothetical protein
MNALQRLILLAFAALLAALAGGCASTEIVSSWRDPDLARVPFRKVLVVFQNSDPQLRRAMELRMAGEIQGAVPSHVIFSDEEVRDLDKVKARVREQGFDSSVIMRIVSVDRELSYHPGGPYLVPSFYHGFYHYWGYGWGMAYDPGYYRTDRILTIATNVYSVADDKLVYASQSQTFNPASLRDAVGEVVRVTSKETGEALKSRG